MRLAIDLGGTNIRIAQVAEGKCLKRNSVACLATQDVDVILTQLFELIEPMIGETVEGIGIGVPSIVDTVHGIVYDAMNIASWKEVHLKELLEEKFGLSSFLAGIIFYTREVLLTSHYEKRLFEHASQPRVACADIRLLSYLWSRTNLSRDSYQSG